MGTFSEHIQQAKDNLQFLSNISTTIDNCWDWQVTACFYSALHLINAHLVKKTKANYLTHNKVNEVINPFNQLSIAKLDEDTYLSYQKLLHLSRRSRYLLGDNEKSNAASIKKACKTHSVHLKRSIHHLEKIIEFVNQTYKEEFPAVEIKCIDLKSLPFNYFKIVE